MFTTIPIAKQCIIILVERAPSDMNLDELVADLKKVIIN
jgi:hypothetical protein